MENNLNNTEQSERRSNLELLRILAMLLIVSYHFSIYGGFHFKNYELVINRFWLLFLAMWGKVGVNLFVLISAYFLSGSQKSVAKRVLKLWLQLISYASMIFFFVLIINKFRMDLFLVFKTIIKTFFPITFNLWWFVSTYIFLILIIPYLNKLISLFSKIEHRNILIFLGIFWSFWATMTNTEMGSNRTLWFAYLYLIAAYIRNHQTDFKKYSKRISFGLVLTIFVNFLAGSAFIVIGRWLPIVSEKSYYLFAHGTGDKSPFTLIISILLFLYFLELELRPLKWINVMASTTLGIYLIHDHYLMRQILWHDLFRNRLYIDSPKLIIYSILVILSTFLGCSLISLLVNTVIKNPINKLIIWISDKTYLRNYFK